MFKLKIDTKMIGEFYFTIGVPIVYATNLWLVVKSGSIVLPDLLRIIALIISFVGMGLWMVSYVNLGGSFGVLPKKQKKVVGGVYRYLRHPMYAGIVLTFSGLSIANQSVAGLMFLLLVTVPLLCIRSVLEEKHLR